MFQVTEFQELGVGVAIRPRKVGLPKKNRAELKSPSQKDGTNWCQIRNCCDKKLCLHYEMPKIHDFGLKSCSSWIPSSHIAR